MRRSTLTRRFGIRSGITEADHIEIVELREDTARGTHRDAKLLGERMGADQLRLILLEDADHLQDIGLVDPVLSCKRKCLFIRVVVHQLIIRTERSGDLILFVHEEGIIAAIAIRLHEGVLREVT